VIISSIGSRLLAVVPEAGYAELGADDTNALPAGSAE
jgi:hypothetical protein